mmetsp:Transcript_6627/g.11812  ORF Transcript_6627/g.11812 Transcript_6627/m.11812 type:complete len:110 (-) Transcript_6627:1814-2143(-)
MAKPAGKASIKLDEEEFQKSMKKPLVKYSDMPTEMGNEAVEVCTMALDKFLANRDYEGASVLIKNTLDKKFGASWQCAVGEGFGFDISCQQKFLLHLYYGKVGILCYKS